MSVPLWEPVLGRISGGLRYNQAVTGAAGAQLTRRGVPGHWPQPRWADVETLRRLVAATDGPVLIDGLIGCSLPDPLDVGLPVVLLVHAPLAENGPEAARRERACLQAASAVVATSHHAAAEIHRLHGLEPAVAVPGTAPRPVAAGGTGGNLNLVCVGALEPNKNQLFLAETLARLAEDGIIGWHCTLAGPVTDQPYADELRRALSALPAGTVEVPGQIDAEELDDLYHGADLLLLPSRRETYGLVVTEAAAAAVPAFVTAGTGAEEALAAGRALPLDHGAWWAALREWLTEPGVRARLCEQAEHARSGLRGWSETATDLMQILRAV